MMIGYTTWGMPQTPVDIFMPYLAELGFDAVELTVLPNYTTSLDALTPTERRRIKAMYEHYDLFLPAVASHRSLLDENPEAHRVNMDILKRAIDLCAEWSDGKGHPVMDTVLGGTPEDWDTKHAFILDRVGELTHYAEKCGVVVGMEAHIGAALDTAEKSVRLVEEINSPYMRLNFDISHFDILGMSIEEAVRLMAPYAAHTHVKDQRGRVPDYEFLIPGEGDFDFVAYLKAMHTAGYTGSITAEVSYMVQRRPDYDPLAGAALCYRTLDHAFETSGVPRERRHPA
ncbi:MAG: sugar phosphate isomerase/epimerase [candidate division Zixibacteria bacterium]|nr:sugar phosphate isomerase/epimerase [candidate division Zixibacteria bacterium]